MLYGQRIHGHSEICRNGTVSRLLGKNSLSSPVEEEKLSMILRSTKQNPSHFPCLPTFN